MRRLQILILTSAVFISTLSFAGCEKKDKLSINNNEKLKNIVLPKEKDQNINLDLYFDSSSNKEKAQVAKEERLVNKEELVGEIIMQELLKGPANVAGSGLKPIFPKETRLLSFSIKDAIAYVSLSGEARTTMSPAKEEALLRSILNSLTQLPSVSKVKIMVDNKDIQSIGGNHDTSKPFGKEDIEGILKK
ncbi:GerMN domain-containing protein [Clostridium swellfunianum]|uniref:GerMN domain-containing protein n=1 Tax=Clostridium swellfunianum TaxID=1367462 RepID=UPI00202EE017|nr:GerMN domain-containing protein [Clostridium swellfunianum]MCM0647136.1 GerMN domain-containing protein [Clostridium swellfunianum]